MAFNRRTPSTSFRVNKLSESSFPVFPFISRTDHENEWKPLGRISIASILERRSRISSIWIWLISSLKFKSFVNIRNGWPSLWGSWIIFSEYPRKSWNWDPLAEKFMLERQTERKAAFPASKILRPEPRVSWQRFSVTQISRKPKGQRCWEVLSENFISFIQFNSFFTTWVSVSSV